MGASRPEQLADTAAAVDVTLDDDLVAAVEAILAPVVVDDPALTDKMTPRTRLQ